ncbi:hypothetical protein GUITHDRAFT_163694 [Guillardia theta CCMP2712]|uniref:Uncharacterized protein n=2 Tax=Guillardia theta TaxID=55529 RepID=L1J7A6_GUITC|nr:hypothetical protein GUITHDRAFT_163694 [Guillardia theta CCMP2712]EKX43960.1 hypothetical protein GUITHDRAFT_163694 [Guillardia theta CCMP2712]|eukprot:XP_005830940.1 hypothetical protein GUITHDRAFT_163694 [Guillardia theta CCMP2712]
MAEAMQRLQRGDSVMEPKAFEDLKACLLAGQEPSMLVEQLSDNYHGYAQMANLLCEWHCFLGDDRRAVDREVRGYLKSMIIKHFGLEQIDLQQISNPRWLEQMIQDPEWRDLIYELSEQFPSSLLISFAMERISQQVGLEAEKAGAESASSKLKIFNSVLKETLADMTNGKEVMPEDLEALKSLICHSEHTFVYVVALFRQLAMKHKGEFQEECLLRLSEEIRVEIAKRGKGRQAEAFCNAITGAVEYPEVAMAIGSMTSTKKTNPSDISKLYNIYTAEIEKVQALTKDENSAMSPETLMALREGIQQCEIVSVGILLWVGGKLVEESFYLPGGGHVRLAKPYQQMMEHCVLIYPAQREILLEMLQKIWDVSLQLGGNGNQEEKVLAGDIAIDNMLFLFELGSVLRAMRSLARWAPVMTPEQQHRTVTEILSCSLPPFSSQFVSTFLGLLQKMPSLDALQLSAESKSLMKDFQTYLEGSKGKHDIDEDLQGIVKEISSTSWS